MLENERKLGQKHAKLCMIELKHVSFQESENWDFEQLTGVSGSSDVEYNPPDYIKNNNYFYFGEVGTISNVSNENKKSSVHVTCVSLSGFVNTKNGPESFLAHFPPFAIIPDDAHEFVAKLKEVLIELKNRSIDDNLEICLTGGHVTKDEHYRKYIVTLRKIVFDAIGVDLKILDEEMKDQKDYEVKDFFVDNNNKRIYGVYYDFIENSK